MAPHAVTGGYDDVAIAPDTERFDYELELAAVICRDVRNVSPDQARSAIGGYCVMNDWSARDVQGREMKLGSLERVDALINNAGVAGRERLPDVDLGNWDRTFAINVTGPMLGIQAPVPLMPPGSSIVKRLLGGRGLRHVAAAYTASKRALRGLTRTASLELGPRGIRVNAVLPGLIETPLMENASPAFRGAALAEIPLGRTGTVDDVAGLMVFLCSDAAAYITGAEIVVDGGLTGHVSHKGIADAIAPVHPGRGRHRALRARPPAARRRVHRRLDRGHPARARCLSSSGASPAPGTRPKAATRGRARPLRGDRRPLPGVGPRAGRHLQPLHVAALVRRARRLARPGRPVAVRTLLFRGHGPLRRPPGGC